ncbi:flagellar hook-length control protein FliK [Clostridium sp. D2Q-14]|uniref:flagellar hook-length control protein FliK n=1 Tax=Anaeromonas gelatinilytica TaxID=2683194 RepID=UPI00193B89BF|nr:flagellar hook-length control protein FliK [Anaeromonas gelatinilytica]MBS4536050.1 flagellar hook-length control protein FliK [Anaeromonas gelatinilytica]
MKINDMIVFNQISQSSNNSKEKNIVDKKDDKFDSFLKKESDKKEKVETSNNSEKNQVKNEKNDNKQIKQKDSKVISKKFSKDKDIDSKENDSEDLDIKSTNDNQILYLINSIINNMDVDAMGIEEIETLSNIEETIQHINEEMLNVDLDSKKEVIKELLVKLESMNNDIFKKDLMEIINKSGISNIDNTDLTIDHKKLLEDLEAVINELSDEVNKKNSNVNIETKSLEIEREDGEKILITEENFDTTNKRNDAKESNNDISVDNDEYIMEKKSNQFIEINSYDNENNLKSKFDIPYKEINNKVTELSSNSFDEFDIINQVKEKITFSDMGDMQVAKIKLKPESLGEVSIKLSIQDGNITGKISVENQEVKQLLVNNIDQLKESFLTKGINVEGFNVSVGEDSQSNNKRNLYSQKRRKIVLDSDLEDLNENDYLTIISNNYQESYIENGSLDIKV